MDHSICRSSHHGPDANISCGISSKRISLRSKSSRPVPIAVYSIGGVMRHTVPNPSDANAREGVEKSFNFGAFTQKDMYFCPLKVYEDPRNWAP